jgi:pimeloyl-ACP methyl ester carboxylesterase
MADGESPGFLDQQNKGIEVRRSKFLEASLALKKCIDEKKESEREARLLDLHRAGIEYFRFVEDCVLDSGGTSGAEFADWLRDITKTALSVLSATPHFYTRLREQREKLGLPKTTFEPSAGFFHHMQGLLASQLPVEAASIKQKFLESDLPIDGFDQPYTPRSRAEVILPKISAPVVVLIHGIRTAARWQRRIGPLLREHTDAVVCPVGYDYQNVFEFLLPGRTRRNAIGKILWRLDKAIDDNVGREVVIIAHSFGTYCVAKILEQNPRIKPARVLLCGSVVDRDFRWDRLRQQPLVVNECGARDVWPPLARSSTWGYGASGTFGFKTPGVTDRYHNASHSDYFDKEFVRKFWASFVASGEIVTSSFEGTMAEPSFFISALAFRLFWFPWLGWLAVALLILIWRLL